MTKITPSLKWHGAKHNLANKIWSVAPATFIGCAPSGGVFNEAGGTWKKD